MANMTWSSDVSFSDRMANVMQISAAYRLTNPASALSEAQIEASSIETKAFEQSDSKDAYQRACDEVTLSFRAHTESACTGQEESEEDSDFAPSSDVERTIGPYQHSTYHRNGLFSTVYRSLAPSKPPSTSSPEFRANAVVALKVTVPSHMVAPHDSRREARILQEARSDHVISLYDMFTDKNGEFVLVCPFMRYDLQTIIAHEGLPKETIASLLHDMFTGLQHIHSLGIIHRDIKPGNILMKTLKGPAYLADFGIAWSQHSAGAEPDDEKITDVGTTSYRAPELLFGNRKYTNAIDLWAAGCVVAEVTSGTGQPLFESGELGTELALIHSIFKSIGTPNLRTWPEAAVFPDWGKMQFVEFEAKPWHDLLPWSSDAERDLVSKLIRYESSDRADPLKALQHPALQLAPAV